MDVRPAYLLAALLELGYDLEERFVIRISEIKATLQVTYNWTPSDDLIDMALELGSAMSVIRLIQSPYAETRVSIPVLDKIYLEEKISLYSRKEEMNTWDEEELFALKENVQILDNYVSVDDEWLSEVIAGIRDTDTEISTQTIEIPASDRTVTLDHNSKEITTVQTDLTSLITDVKASNSFGDEDPEEKDAVLADMAAGHELLKSGHFWVKSLWETLIKALQYLIKKFGDASVGVAAKKLLEEIMKLVG